MRVTAALSLLLLALVLGPDPARAGSDLLIGVHDDSIKWTERPARIFGAMQALDLGGMRVTLEWRPGKRSLTGSDHDAADNDSPSIDPVQTGNRAQDCRLTRA